MSANFHPLVYIIDYIFGVIMWTLIGRVAMNFFQKEDSQFFFMKVFVKFTNPLLKVFKPLTPSFIIQPLVPLYVAWFFYLFRFSFWYNFQYLLTIGRCIFIIYNELMNQSLEGHIRLHLCSKINFLLNILVSNLI